MAAIMEASMFIMFNMCMCTHVHVHMHVCAQAYWGASTHPRYPWGSPYSVKCNNSWLMSGIMSNHLKLNKL